MKAATALIVVSSPSIITILMICFLLLCTEMKIDMFFNIRGDWIFLMYIHGIKVFWILESMNPWVAGDLLCHGALWTSLQWTIPTLPLFHQATLITPLQTNNNVMRDWENSIFYYAGVIDWSTSSWRLQMCSHQYRRRAIREHYVDSTVTIFLNCMNANLHYELQPLTR